MPIYEYICRDCDHPFQKLQSMTAGSDDVHCPKCGGDRVERQLSAFASAPSGADAGRSAGCAPAGGG
jgi:putative FmdB family regulatory protein